VVAGDGAERDERVRDGEEGEGRVGVRRGPRLRDHRGRGARRHGLGEVVVRVEPLAPERDEELPRRERGSASVKRG
jgi:hypothetical protein